MKFNDLIGDWLEDDEDPEAFGDLRGMLTVQSSNLAAVRYDAAAYILIIAFLDGSVYRYEGVPPEEYRGLLGADSHGEYFVENIRNVYFFERILG